VEHAVDASVSKGGRVSKLSAQDKRFCVRSLTSDKVGTAVAVTKLLEDSLNVDVSERTVRRALQGAGLKAAEKKSVPLLSVKNVKARL
jgi:transposase